MTTAPPRTTTGSLWLIFVIAFLNLVGATIIMPVLPFIVPQYVYDPAAVGLWIGILASAFSLCAFLSAPALGKLSDRVGRKPVLFVSLLGSAIGFVVLGIGGAMWVLLLGRVISALGVINVIGQGGLLRILLPRIGARRVVLVGLAGEGIGYAVLGVVAAVIHAPWLLAVGVLFWATAEATTTPALTGLLSAAVSDAEQGWLMGGLTSVNSAARVVGPLLAGLLYSGIGHAAPYWFGVIAIVAVLFLAQPLLRSQPAAVVEEAAA